MSAKKLLSMNPYNEEVLAEFEYQSIEAAIQLAKRVQKNQDWTKSDIRDRSKAILQIAAKLGEQREVYAKTITLEMGKRISESLAEIDKCVWLCEYFGKNAEKLLEPEHIETEYEKSYVRFDSLGVILAIMPWNFPFWQVFRFVIPALLVGNRALLKHASNVPQSALHIEEVLNSVLPKDVFANVFLPGSETGGLIASNHINGVSFTGSTSAGMQVAATAGKHLKKHVLELGGSDPFIVFEDADIGNAIKMAVSSRFVNSGESCIAAKRIILVEPIAENFISNAVKTIKELKLGDPLDESSDVCPLAKSDIRDDLLEQVEDAKQRGAEIIIGGNVFGEKGFIFEPTIITGVNEEMRVLTEETFGPVMPIIVVKDEEEAIRVANNSSFGLGASIWTQDIEKAEKYAAMIEAGFVAINDMVKSDPRLPFGGVKKSGYGRELSSYGIKEFSNIKTVVVKVER